MNQVYKRVEDFEDGEDDFRGAGGPIKVTRHTQQVEPSLQFRQAAADTLGVKIVKDVDKSGFQDVSRPIQDKLAKDLGPNAEKVLGLVRNLK